MLERDFLESAVAHVLLSRDRELDPPKKPTGQTWGRFAGAPRRPEVHILRTNTTAMTDLQIPAIAIALFHGTILKAGRARASVSEEGTAGVHVKSHLDCLRFMSATLSSPSSSALFAAVAIQRSLALLLPGHILTFVHDPRASHAVI